MAIIGFQKGSGRRSRVREKSVKSQGILIRIMSGNPVTQGSMPGGGARGQNLVHFQNEVFNPYHDNHLSESIQTWTIGTQ